MKISVIIPVYNVEKYLSQCIDSIINQTYSDLEIILSDDGSTDRCPQICDEYAVKDKRIQVIHKNNGGAASARNAALRIAKGEFLAFVDSDDFIELNTFEAMMDIHQRTQADIVECAFSNDYVNKQKDRIFFQEETEFTQIEYLKLFSSHWICGLAWDKLFKRNLLNGIFYEEGHQIDDEFFTYQGVMNANKIIYSPLVLYHYRMRESSLMRDKSAVERMMFDRLEYSRKRRENVVSRYPELKQNYDLAYLNSLIAWSKAESSTIDVIIEIQQLLLDYFKNNKPCKMKPRFRLQLLQLQCADPQKIMMKRPIKTPKKSENQYYE